MCAPTRFASSRRFQYTHNRCTSHCPLVFKVELIRMLGTLTYSRKYTGLPAALYFWAGLEIIFELYSQPEEQQLVFLVRNIQIYANGSL